MIALLVSLLFLMLFVGFLVWAVNMIATPVPQPWRNAIVGIVALIVVLSYFGAGGYGYVHTHYFR